MNGYHILNKNAEGRDLSGLLQKALIFLIALKFFLVPLIFDVNTFASFDDPKAAVSHVLAWLMVFVITAMVFIKSEFLRLKKTSEKHPFVSFRPSPAVLCGASGGIPFPKPPPRDSSTRGLARNDTTGEHCTLLKKPHFFILAFIISAIISTIFSADRYIAFFGYPYRMLGLATILDLGILYAAIVIAIKHPRDFRLILWSFIAGAVLSSSYAALQYFKLDVYVWGSQLGARVFSTFGNPDFYGQYLSVLVISLAGVIAFQPLRTRFRIMFLLLFAGAMVLVGAVGTRSALIGIMAGMTMLLVLWLRRTPVKRNMMVRLGLLFLSGGIMVAAILSQTFIREKLTWYWIRRGFIQRGVIYETVLKEFADRPIFGIGPDNIGVLYFRYRPAREVNLRGPFYLDSSAHGWPMQILATQGLVGFVIFLFILFITARTAWKLARHERYGPFASIIAAALAAHFGTGLITPGSISTEWIGWTGIALLAAVRGLDENNKVEDSAKTKKWHVLCHSERPRTRSAAGESRNPLHSWLLSKISDSSAPPSIDHAQVGRNDTKWTVAGVSVLLLFMAVTLFGIYLSIRPWLASRYAAVPVFLLKQEGEKARDQYVALRAAIKATELDPGRSDLWKLRGSTEEFVGNLSAAAISYAEAARLSPEYPEHWWNLARINVRLVEKGDKTKKEAALSAMEQAIVSDPNGPESYASAAKLLLLLGDNARALESAEKGIQLFQNKSDYYILAATAAHRLGQSEKAEKILKQGIDVFSVTGIGLSSPLYLALAELYFELHEIKKSDEQIGIVLERDPNNAEALAFRNKLKPVKK